jgi:TonB family protein
MIETPVRHRHARCALYAVAASGLVFLACDTPVPRTSADQVAGPDQHAALGSDVVYADANSELVPPERVSCPVPEYPEALRDAGRQGQVMTQFVVGADGSVEPATVEIISSSDSAFDTSARDMVARCRFRAGTVNDEAVRVLTQMPVVFRLGGPESLGASSDGGNRGGDTGSIIVRRSSADTVPPPIYIVDGVIVQNGSALDLDALRIESIEVVKGEQARQRYGERGRNGVILITTKK